MAETDMQFEADRLSFLSLIRKEFAAHPRRGNSEVDHSIAVMRMTDLALDLESVDPSERRLMLLGALGHDLYEDTDIDLEVPFQKHGEAGEWLRGVLRRKRERFWSAMKAVRKE
jgi:hypothetical protein